jgi:uncharacterized damage-inducible protein DinB
MELFRYGDAVNDLVMNAACKLPDEQLDRSLDLGFGSIRRICRHLLAGETTWLARIRGDVEAKWPDEQTRLSIPQMLQQLESVRAGRQSFLATLQPAQLSSRQRYRDSKGSVYEATLQEMLLQTVIHGIYHRAQIVDCIQLVGGTPPAVDYMYLVRKPT